MTLRDFQLCPRVKKTRSMQGEYTFHSLDIFTIGEGELFCSAIKIFQPALQVRKVSREEANLLLSVSYVYASAKEFCSIRITKNRIEIQCTDNAGARNAAAILAQIIYKNENGAYVLPCGIIEDWPDASYRSMMLDNACRVLIPMKKMYDYIKQMALCRMNVLQYHFMSEKGNSIQFDTVPDMAGCGEENFKFTKEEIRKMISFAAELGITVTPCIQVLTHVHDFPLKAGITCPGDDGPGLFDVCVGQEKTFEVIEKIIAEVADLFPDDVIQIGADEYDMRRVSPRKPQWEKCPHCRKLSEEKGFTTLNELYLYGVERINNIVNKMGKVTMMWNADVKPEKLPEDFARNAVIQYYRFNDDLGKEKLFDLYVDSYIDDGFSVINSYYPQTYLDYSAYMNAEKLNGWSYLMDPRVKRDNRAKVSGACCCAWGKHEHYCRTVPAAILLFADRLWNADGDPVPYDDNYGRTMTRILFDRKLPDDINVFACLGSVLPPLECDGKAAPAHMDSVTVDLNELKRVREALLALAAEKDDLAQVYADAIHAVIQTKLEESEEIISPAERIFFLG